MQIRDNFISEIEKITNERTDLENRKCDKKMLFNCQERELLAKKDMYTWEQRQVQVEVNCRNVIRCCLYPSVFLSKLFHNFSRLIF